MNNQEIIQRATEETLKNENTAIKELDRQFFELDKELKYCEDELVGLGFNPTNPDLIPQFKNDAEQVRYLELVNTRAGLIEKINSVKGDLHLYKNSQEN